MRSDQNYRRKSLSLYEPLCRDLMLPQFLLAKVVMDPSTFPSDKGEELGQHAGIRKDK